MSGDDTDTEGWPDDWPEGSGAKTLRIRDCGDHVVIEEDDPEPGGGEPVKPAPSSEIVIDLRGLIRESRGFHQSTAGPPRPGTNEIGSGGLGPPTEPCSCSPKRSPRDCTANLIRIADFCKPALSGAENCAQPDAETAMRDLEQEGLADDQHPKTRH